MAHATYRIIPVVSGTVQVAFGGRWCIDETLPVLREATLDLSAQPARHVHFIIEDLEQWDTSLVAFAGGLIDYCARSHIVVHPEGLPEGVQRLLALASEVPQFKEGHVHARTGSFITSMGKEVLGFVRSAGEIADFLGESILALRTLLKRKTRFRGQDFWLLVQEVGAEALPIISLISFLVGMIIAYIGAVQLEKFGATIFVANLVGLAMTREMAAMMTAIVLAGRTGAAFAARIGTMTVNEEVDALRTLGISPMEFLVVPRILALLLMVPLLVIYANLLGILGGALVAVTSLGFSPLEYLTQTQKAVGLTDIVGGLVKGTLYGGIVAVCGCMRGMQCGRSAEAVGQAATSAVVTGIVFIVVASAVTTVVYNVLGV